MDSLRDKVAVITGAASGIGRATARALANHGAHIVAVDRDDEGIGALADELGQARVLPQRADVSDPQAFEDIRSAALQRFGRVDLVANNVGVLTNGLPQDIPVTEWQRILDINLMSVVRSNAAFLPLLLEQGSGHLVNTASFAGLFSYSYDRLPYAASKAAIVQISEGLGNLLAAQEHRRHPAVPGAGADQYRRCRTKIRRRGTTTDPRRAIRVARPRTSRGAGC